MTVKIQRDTHI